MAEYRKWKSIATTIAPNPFMMFERELDALQIPIDAALLFFTQDFENASTQYDNDIIVQIFRAVELSNVTKYQKLITVLSATYNPIENYNMTEDSTDIRKPDLTNQVTLNTQATMTDTRATTTTDTRATATTGTSTTTNKFNQTKSTTDTPNDYKETSTRAINPYDNPGFVDESREIITQSGARTVAESYSGNADEMQVNADSTVTNSGGTSTTNTGETSTSNTGTNTQTETGTDTTEHKLTRKGNIGVTTSQQMLEAEINLADKMNMFKIIEQDIAAKLFLQVWL